eukprot:m.179496 g.179496  ORF g.179496 m.179496 type:complete len:89 (-) comp14641_c1_seq14:33-299(-)
MCFFLYFLFVDLLVVINLAIFLLVWGLKAAAFLQEITSDIFLSRTATATFTLFRSSLLLLQLPVIVLCVVHAASSTSWVCVYVVFAWI